MKKMLSLIICLLVSLILFSCSNDNPGDRDNDTSGSDSSIISGGETEIIINPGEWELPGVLTLPDGSGPFPLVVFVHGSGPLDRDETVGKQKLFKDLAEDLSKLGVASIRYDKRTYVYSKKMADDVNLTVKEEAIDDVINAVLFAKQTSRIDQGKIYVAGHSMGGYLIPRIDKADSENMISGYISLAGSVRSITELLEEQVDYILSLDKTITELDKANYKKQIASQINDIKNLKESDRGSNTVLYGAYPAYWLDLAGYQPEKEISDVEEPILFLQGEHDYQVTMTDFSLWKDALKDKSNAEFISYPGLSHTFVKTENMSIPNDYNIRANADGQVSQDIYDFICG